MRVLVYKNGKVIKGKEQLFNILVKNEALQLKEIDSKLRQENPELYKNIPITSDWEKEAVDSIDSASHRFGCGEIWLEENIQLPP